MKSGDIKQSHIDKLVDVLSATICFLAAFPTVYFRTLTSWKDRSNIIVKGISVLISPAAFTFSLMNNGPIMLGSHSDSKVLWLLPVLAFLLDWSIVSSQWNNADNKEHRMLLSVLRLLLILISLGMAFGAALSPEKENLTQSLRRHEMAFALKNNPNLQARSKLIEKEIQSYQSQINSNEDELGKEADIREQLDTHKTNAYLEEHGTAGVDEQTHTRIIGGGVCGQACKTNQAKAAKAQSKLAYLGGLSAKNEALKSKILDAEEKRLHLFDDYLSDQNSFGTLLKAMPYADFGVQIKIALWLIMMLTLELSALLTAHLPVSENLRQCIAFEGQEDLFRTKSVNKSRVSLIQRDHIRLRQVESASLPPVVISIPTISERKLEKTATAKNHHSQVELKDAV